MEWTDGRETRHGWPLFQAASILNQHCDECGTAPERRKARRGAPHFSFVRDN